MKFSITDFFSKCDEVRTFLRIWSHLLKKSVVENFIFCAGEASTIYPMFQLHFATKTTSKFYVHFLHLLNAAI